ncbi:MAG: aldehyde ferredoxin oxidoreductase N-terminal domain-containing protein [Candidatus Hodarchaeota archaeon]
MSLIPQDILEIDLTTESVKKFSKPDLFDKWIGGIGVGINLLQNYVSNNTDPLSEENVIIFSIGTLSTFYPIVSKTAAVFRSPLNGDLGESYAGGRLSLAMRFAGLGALILRGRAEKTCIITINNDEVNIRRAGPLAYMYTSTIGRVLRELVPIGPGRRSSIRIGQASENLVKYGNIVVDSFRHFGRLGVGTALGSKRVKAIVVSGEKDIPLDSAPIDRREYLKVYKKIWDLCVKTDIMKKYHVLGTPQSVLPLNEMNALPTKNFTLGRFDHANEISGEKFVESYLGRRIACNTCPVGCIHVAILRERYGMDSPADIHSIAVPYDYEPIYALGSNLMIGNGIELLKLIEESEKLGIDAITLGVVLGWLSEAFEKGIITKEDTNGQLIRFGNLNDYLEVIKRITYRGDDENDIFWIAGEGLEALIKKYGGEDFTVKFNNNPPAGYSTGPYSMIGHAIGGRHSHLDNAGYSLDQKTFGKRPSPKDAIFKLVKEEEWRNVLNSLVICLFARNLFTPSIVLDCFKALGIEKSEKDLLDLGLEIQQLRIKSKINFGFKYESLREDLTQRILNMPTAHGQLSFEEMSSLLDSYYELLTERYQLKKL